jgi:hypothetical protein
LICPLKWSSLKYVFRMEDKNDGKEEGIRLKRSLRSFDRLTC